MCKIIFEGEHTIKFEIEFSDTALATFIISKLSCCVYRHVPSIIVKKGKLPKHQLKHEFNFLWYKVCKIVDTSSYVYKNHTM